MYSNEYDDDEYTQENENFLVSFYRNNKLLIWIFLGIVIFILLISLLTRGGSNKEPNIEYAITIYPEEEVFVNIGRSTNLTAIVKNDPKAEVVWSIENPNIAVVDNGNVKGLDYGKTKVTATYIDNKNNKYTDSRSVTVADGDPSITLTDVSFKKGDLFMPLNSTYQIALTLTPSRGYIENEVFTSSNSNVAKVDDSGVVTAVGEGHAVITFDVNNGHFRKELNVYVERDFAQPEIIVSPEKISFDGEVRKIKVGNTEKLSYTVKPQDVDVDRLIWKSSDEEIVTVENGMITAIKEGRAIITVSGLNGETDRIDVEVQKSIIDITDIELDESSIELNVGESKTIKPAISPSDASNKALSYTSNDEYIAFVEANETGTKATITGISEGSTTIIIESCNNIKKKLKVVVVDPDGKEDDETVDPGKEDSGIVYPPVNPGSSGGSTSETKGFNISSRDANGEKYVTNLYSAGKQNNNGAVAPVTITVEKISSSVDRLVVLVCYYSSSSSCGNLGRYETYGSTSFTLTNAGEYVIRIEEYDVNNNRIRTNDRYIWIKQGVTKTTTPTPKPTATAKPTVTISCTKTQVKVGENFNCTAGLTSGDSISLWKIGGQELSSKSKTVYLTAPNTAGTRYLKVTTTKGATKEIAINVTGTTKTPTPKPTATPRPTVTISCTKTQVKAGEDFNCTAGLTSGDTVAAWSMGSTTYSSRNKTIYLTAPNTAGTRYLKVTTTKGATKEIAISVIGSTPKPTATPRPTVTISCSKTQVKVGENFNCTAGLTSGDTVAAWSMGSTTYSSRNKTIYLTAPSTAGTRYLKVTTTKGATKEIAISVIGSTQTSVPGSSYNCVISLRAQSSCLGWGSKVFNSESELKQYVNANVTASEFKACVIYSGSTNCGSYPTCYYGYRCTK